MMGMGEPLLNLDNVMRAVRLMADPEGVAIPLRAVSTVSTSGIIPKIAEFGAHEVRPKLAISLNASTEEKPPTPDADHEQASPQRPDRSLPTLSACGPGRHLTFEYVLLRRRQRFRRRTRAAW